MNNEIHDGGTAFPCSVNLNGMEYHRHIQDVKGNLHCTVREVPGMSLRDYFAAKAMSGMLIHLLEYKNKAALTNYEVDELLSKACYEIADAMLKARQPTLE